MRRPIAAGEPVTTGRIIKPGSRGFLAAVLRPGYRAVSLRVNATSSISGLVFPGDRVDIILTHNVSAGRVSETILTNVRILAIDQLTNDQTQAPKIGKHATFEVTPKQAEMVTVLSDMGRLSLSLRSLATDEADLERLANADELPFEAETEKGSTHTFTSEVSRLIRRGSLLNQDRIQVIRGDRTTELRFKKGKLINSVSMDPDPKNPLADDNPEVADKRTIGRRSWPRAPIVEICEGAVIVSRNRISALALLISVMLWPIAATAQISGKMEPKAGGQHCHRAQRRTTRSVR